MQTLNSAFNDALLSQTPGYIKKIYLCPRCFQDGAESYSQPVDISDKVCEISPIKWKMDTQEYGLWENSNCTITLTNIFNEFAKGGPFFPQGSVFYKSKIIVSGGIKASGAKHLVDIFEGFVIAPPLYQTEEKKVSLTISGRLSTLADFSAEDICAIVDNEEHAQAQDNIFYTLRSGVKEIISLKRGTSLSGATELNEIYDYSIEDLEKYKKPAAIKLKNPLPAGEFVWVTYKCWHEDKDLDWIAHQIADACGAPSRKIDKVSFGGGALNIFEENAIGATFNGDFDSTVSSANGVTLSSEFPAPLNAQWEIVENPSAITWHNTPNSVAVDGSLTSYASVRSQQELFYGTWEGAFKVLNNTEGMYYHFISDTGIRTTSKGYCVSVVKNASGKIDIKIYRSDSGTLRQIGLVSRASSAAAFFYKVRIVRLTTGYFKIWSAPVTAGELEWTDHGNVCRDVTHRKSSYQIVAFSNLFQGEEISDMGISATVSSVFLANALEGNYYSPVIFGGESFSGWDLFSFLDECPAGAQSIFYYRTKDSQDGAFSAWLALEEGKVTADGQYLQLRWACAVSPSAPENMPVLKFWKITWFTQSTKIGLLNFNSINCLEVMKELAVISGFEIGFERDGTFLFKKRNTDCAGAFSLDKRHIINLELINDGSALVCNNIKTVFGDYYCTVNSFEQEDAVPNSEQLYGRKEITISTNYLLPEHGVDMAKTLASSLYQKLSKAKKRAVVVIRFLPQLDLGDIVKINYSEPLVSVPERLSLNNIFMSVEGIEFDLENWTMRLDLAEVL